MSYLYDIQSNHLIINFEDLPNRVSVRRLKALHQYRLIGLVVKASTSRVEDPGFESCFLWDFFGA